MIDELRERIRKSYKPDFDFTKVSDVPFVMPSKPISRVALITTAGLYFDEPFDRANPDGDSTFRRIHASDDLSRLRIDWDSPAREDINCAFPLALLSEPAEIHYSLSGAIPDPRPLLADTAPQIARELREAAVDGVIIAPS